MIPIDSICAQWRRFIFAVFMCISMLTMLALPSFAQTAGAGTITGTITDSSQAVIPGATITVTNDDTGIAHAYTTNSAGFYVAPFLQPGHYTVTGSASNFGSAGMKNLTLLVGQTLTIDLTLKVQSSATTVEVRSDL